ncbi:MAG: glycosyltransferase [Deltaproteobacteria bacterium]|nr:glycosyltransferase [Deltaproteobacteria bacterium]
MIPSGITPVPRDDKTRAAMRKELGASDNDRLIGVVAELVPHKGHRFLLDAMPEVARGHAESRLVVVGDGPLRSELEGRAADLNLVKKVRFLGRREDVPRLLNAFDLFVMPSVTEGLGTSILDAMSAGVPVVATDAGGIPEIVRAAETGLIAKAGDASSLARALRAALANPDAARERAERAAAMVGADYTAEATAQKTLAYYREILGAKGTGS